MAWPAFTSDSLVSGRGVETDGTSLIERIYIGVSRPLTWYFAETNFTTTLADVQSIAVQMPPWAVTGSVVELSFIAYRTGAVSGNANFRLQQGATNGSTLNTALSTTVAVFSVDVTAPDDSWADALVTFDLQAQRPASGADADWTVMTKRMIRNFVVVAP